MRFILLLLLVPTVAFAKTPEESRLATGLGIAAPDVSSIVNFTTGYTTENPAGVLFQEEYRASLQLVREGGINDVGVEAGAAGKTFGIALGLLQPGCNACLSTMGVMLGAAVTKDFNVGASYQTSNSIATYGGGILYNPTGTHRLGVVADYYNPPTPNTQITTYSGGYAYVTKSSTIAVELAGQKNDADPIASKLNLLSLGFQKRVESLQLSVNYQRTLNSTAAVTPEFFWLGGGFNGETWHLGVYSNMHKQFMAVLSAFM
jgi:hypothetical protein